MRLIISIAYGKHGQYSPQLYGGTCVMSRDSLDEACVLMNTFAVDYVRTYVVHVGFDVHLSTLGCVSICLIDKIYVRTTYICTGL